MPSKFIVIIGVSRVSEQLQALLEQEGHQIEVFPEPVLAYGALKAGKIPRPDLFFIHLHLAFDGYKLISLLKGNIAFQHIPIVALSSQDGIVPRLQARLAGATAFLPFPFTDKDVVTLIQALV